MSPVLLAAVGAGGAAGSLAAYGIAHLAARATWVLAVIATSAFALGAVARLGVAGVVVPSPAAAVVTTFLGAIASFALPAWYLTESSDRRHAARAVAGIVAVGIAAAVLGYASLDLAGLAYLKTPQIG